MSAALQSHAAEKGGRGELSSGEDLSSPPRSSPDPGSPSQQFANEFASNQNSSITVNPPGNFSQPETKPVVPVKERKKPGRKPGSVSKVKANADSSATNTDAPKQKRTRKPKDPNAPTRRKKNASLEAANEHVLTSVAGPSRQPQVPEAGVQPTNFNPQPENANSAQTGNNETIPR
jgi:hypothetical protein